VMLVPLMNGGFDAIVGNPPFMSGTNITGQLGTEYRDTLVEHVADGVKGRADLSAYFLLRAGQLIRRGAVLGMVTTNSISDGDTREIGLDSLVSRGYALIRATSSEPWPGEASLQISKLWICQGPWRGPAFLDGARVRGITTQLEPASEVDGQPFRLASNHRKSFKGFDVLGMGFTLSEAEVSLIKLNEPLSLRVIQTFMNGEDLTNRPDASGSRWIINFGEMSEGEASQYTEVWRIVEERVKPERQRKREDGTFVLRKPLPQKYWQYNETRPALVKAMESLQHVLILPVVTKYLVIGRAKRDVVFSHQVVVFPTDRMSWYSTLQSNIHETWARTYSGAHETRLRYSPTDCFENYPFPESLESLEEIGERYYAHRQSIMTARQEGLTRTYNRVHNPEEHAEDIQQLRELRIEMDRSVALAYGWSELDLEHGFHQTAQGLRFTISEAARREILERLLILNHARYEAEVAAGLHDKPTKGKGKGRPASQQSRAEAPARKRGAASGRREPAVQTLPLLGDDLT
jgi:hypothetical protein